MKRVTVQDIADALGLSRNTVSKAINNSGCLAEATREKILQKAVEMGYKQFSYINRQSGFAAKDPRERGEIALLIGSEAPLPCFSSELTGEMKKAFLRRGYTLVPYQASRENVLQRTLPRAFDPAEVRGIVCVDLFDRAYDEMICSLGLPVLFVDGPSNCGGISLPADQLYMESTAVVTRLVSELLARGRRRIGFIGDYDRCQSQYERYAAFLCAMLMAGAPVEKRFCLKTDDPEEIGAALSALPDQPDGWICAGDPAAVEAVRALGRLGKGVPEDLMVCGFGDAPEARAMKPALTTVHIHTGAMAASAVQLLLSRINEPDLDYRVVHTETELIRRDSAGN